jgi:YHS domain-containing protein
MHHLSRRNAVCLLPLIAAFVLATPSSMLAQQEVPLAIKGYDAVAYFDAGKPTLGLAEIEYEHDGLRYRFASAEHRELFKRNPASYAPQFGNYCAMALAKGLLVIADPQHWLIHDGKLYVFGSPPPAGPVLFQKELTANIAKANQNRTLLIKH